MPNLDGTGPQGQGSKTGRGLGNCDTPNTPNTANPQRRFLGRFAGFGRGLGRGWGRRRNPNGRQGQN